MKVKTVIKCDKCNKLHLENSGAFFTVRGNIYVGLEGGIVGNNLQETPKKDVLVVNDSHYCKVCLRQLLVQDGL